VTDYAGNSDIESRHILRERERALVRVTSHDNAAISHKLRDVTCLSAGARRRREFFLQLWIEKLASNRRARS